MSQCCELDMQKILVLGILMLLIVSLLGCISKDEEKIQVKRMEEIF